MYKVVYIARRLYRIGSLRTLGDESILICENNPCERCDIRKLITNPEKLLHKCSRCKHRESVIKLQQQMLLEKKKSPEETAQILEHIRTNKDFY